MRRTVHLVGLLVLLPTAMLAQTTSELFQQSMDAHGRAEVERTYSVVLEATISERGQNEPVTIAVTLDGWARWDFGRPVRRTIITTPEQRFDVIGKTPYERPPHVGAFGQADVLGILGTRHLANARHTPQPPVLLNGQPALRVRVDTGRRLEYQGTVTPDEADVLFDPQTSYVIGISRAGRANRESLLFTETYVFSDFRNAGGLVFPFRIERYLNQSLQQTISVSAVQLNAAVNPRIFTLQE